MKRVAILLMVVLFAISFQGCNKKDKSEEVVNIVKDYFTALAVQDFKRADTYLAEPMYDQMNENEKEFTTYVYKSMNLGEISLIDKSSNSAVVSVELDIIDQDATVQRFIKMVEDQAIVQERGADSFTNEELDDFMRTVMTDDGVILKHDTIEIHLVKLSGKWKVTVAPEDSYDYVDDYSASELVFLESKTDVLKFYDSDSDGSMCAFLDDADYVFMYCEDEMIADLSANYAGKMLEVTYDVLQYGDFSEKLLELKKYKEVKEQ